LDGIRSAAYDGHLEASTAMQITSVLRYARAQLPLEAYELDFGTIGTPGVVVDDLTAALTKGIDELTRPVDAIKHQAKTVTVGIRSRTEQDPRLRGTKNRTARQREVTAGRGGDGRTLVFVPETKGNEVTGITLLHVAFRDRLAADVACRLLEGYQTRLAALRDAVTEI